MNILKNVVLGATLLGLASGAFAATDSEKTLMISPQKRTVRAVDESFMATVATNPDNYSKDIGQARLKSVVDLGVESYGVVKDTRMLFTDLGELRTQWGWDKRTDEGYLDASGYMDSRVHIMGRCWAVAPYNVYHYFLREFQKKNASYYKNFNPLSQDEMVYWGKTTGKTNVNQYKVFGLCNSIDYKDCNSGGNYRETEAILNKMFRNKSGSHVELTDKTLSESVVEQQLKQGKPLIITVSGIDGLPGHVMVIDALAKGSYGIPYVHLVNINNFGGELYYRLEYLKVERYFNYSVPTDYKLESSDPNYSPNKDSDKDGITDFDEKYRFGSSPTTSVTSAGVSDMGRVSQNTQQYVLRPVYGVNEANGTMEWHGLENGAVYGNAIFNVEDRVPNGVAVYSKTAAHAYENSYCQYYIPYATADKDNVYRYEPCKVMLENSTGYNTALTLYPTAVIGEVYSKGAVKMGDKSVATMVRFFKSKKSTDLTKGSGVVNAGASYYSASNWTSSPSATNTAYAGEKDVTVSKGSSYTLVSGAKVKNLVVKSGAALYLGEGDLKLNSLNIEAGAKVRFVNLKGETNLLVKSGLTWKGTMINVNTNIKRYNTARGLNVIYHGSNSIYLSTDWYGSLFAPNANVYLSTSNGDGINFYGSVCAKYVSIGKSTRIYYVQRNRYNELVNDELSKAKTLYKTVAESEVFDSPAEPSVDQAMPAAFVPALNAEGLSLTVANVPQNNSVAIFDIKGKKIAQKMSNGSELNFALPVLGRYIVRSGSYSQMISIK